MSGYDVVMPSDQIKATKMCCQFRNQNMHTQEKDGKVQFAVTLTPATTKVEKKNKDTSGGATERIRRDIFYPKAVVGGSR